jgi:hypothetical protein
MLIIRFMILLLFSLTLSCAGSHSSPWKPFHFDGANFSPAAENSSNALWLRSGHFPSTTEPAAGAAISDRLPPGTGAVAGICYIQTSGGKISQHDTFAPYPNEQITFRNKTDGVSVTRTDKNGYFTEYLTAGNYELFCRGVRTEFRIKPGETTLVPIRGGKRMAD